MISLFYRYKCPTDIFLKAKWYLQYKRTINHMILFTEGAENQKFNKL